MIEILVDGLDHPEGVCWDPVAGVLWTGGEAGQVYRVQLDERRAEEVAPIARPSTRPGARGIPLHYPTTWAADA